MNSSDLFFASLMSFLVLIGVSFWWGLNAPYCCVHLCGCTTTCWGNVVIPFLFTVSCILIIAAIAAKNEKNYGGKKW